MLSVVVERHRRAKYTTRSKTLPPIVVSARGGLHVFECWSLLDAQLFVWHPADTATLPHALPPPPLLTVQARVCSGGSHLTIRISDQGGGIPQQHLNQVGDTCQGGGSSWLADGVLIVLIV